jgi:hypothetical protein
MKPSGFKSLFILLVIGLFLTSCLLPGMIPMDGAPAATSGPMPTMETDPDVLLETLQGGEWTYLQALAEEEYTDEEYAKPGTLTFNVTITDDQPTYFNYGWCTTTQEILQQNFEHIRITLYFNDEALGEDVVHPITFTRPDGFVCLDFGVMMSDWVNGEYQLRSVVTFEEQINAGDYIYEYNVTVNKP